MGWEAGMRAWIVILVIALAAATLVSVGSIAAIAIPDLTTFTSSHLELAWKISAALGTATGVALGWLVSHRFALDQLTHKATLDAAQKIVDRAAAIDSSTLETVVKGRVELEIRQQLIVHQEDSNKKLEEYRKELELKFQRDLLEITNQSADRKAKQAARAPALIALMQSIKGIQASFKALTQIGGIYLSQDEVRRRIESAMAAKAELDRDRQLVQAAYIILPVGFEKLMRRVDRLMYDIIAEVRSAPEGDGFSDGSGTPQLDFQRTAKRMKAMAAHLRTLTDYSITVIERELDPNRFYEVRVLSERNRHARSLMRMSKDSAATSEFGSDAMQVNAAKLGSPRVFLLPPN